MARVISVSDLFMDYGQGNVLNQISFEVESGQIIGYIGPNGAGKSTTIKIFLGIITNYKGKVEIFGEDIRGKYLYKKRIGYVPEVIELYESLTYIFKRYETKTCNYFKFNSQS